MLKPGTGLYKGHNKDNSTKNRGAVGKVITSLVKEIGNKMQVIALSEMQDDSWADYDVCSIEADILEKNNVVYDVAAVSGIAVANSKFETPAFSSARLLTSVQCFVNDAGGTVQKNKPGEGREKMPVTLEDLLSAPIGLFQTAVKQRDLHPNQLFSVDDLANDREFGKIVVAKTDLEKKVEELEKKVKEGEISLTKANKELAIGSAEKLLNEAWPEGTTDRQKQIVTKLFNPVEMEKVDKESVTKFVTDTLNGPYKEFAKIFGEIKEQTSGSAGDMASDNSSIEQDLEAAFEE